MFHLDNNSGVSAMPPVGAVQSSAPRWYTEGGGGTPASYPGADWYNIIQAELLNLLSAYGINPNKSDFNQLQHAIEEAISQNATANSALLTAIAALVTSANKMPYFTGKDKVAMTDLTAFARTLLGRSDAAGVLSDLGLVGVAENLIINGAFNINQRAYVSGTALTAAAYAHDRWKAGSGGCTYAFGSTADTITITAGSLQQVIEGVNNPGGTVTLTWSGTAQCRVNGGAYSTSPLTVTGLTAGQNVTVEFGAGTVARVQCSAGSVPFTFNRRNYSDEQRLCQRYYQVQKGANITSSYVATGDAHVAWFMKTTMRVSPTVGLNGGNGTVYSVTPDSVDVKLTVGAQNYAVIVDIICDAEL